MDQFIATQGQAGHALLLDCRSLDFKLLRLPESAAVVICNTMVKHDLATGEYNLRRAQCEEGVHRLSEELPGIRALRDVSAQQLEEHRAGLDPLTYQRCRHVVTENARVLQAAEALFNAQYERFGELMSESHRSLRDDYEVSCKELDTMVEIAMEQPGCLGARMTGGGFGGCTVNLVLSEAVHEFRSAVGTKYAERIGVVPEIYVTQASQGVEEIMMAAGRPDPTLKGDFRKEQA
jgi:galactokinase